MSCSKLISVHIERAPEMWLLGLPQPTLKRETPTWGDVLRVVTYNHLFMQRSLSISNLETAEQLIENCVSNGFLPMEKKHIVQKINTKYKLYKTLKKFKHRESPHIQQRVDDFVRSLDDIFYAQKMCIASRPTRIVQPVVSTLGPELLSEAIDTVSNGGSENENDSDDTDVMVELSWYQRQQLQAGSSGQKEKTLIDVVMSSKDVISMADRVNLSDRKFLLLVAAIARAAGENFDQSTFSRASLQRIRNRHRSALVEDIEISFNNREKVPLTVHWDDKIMNNFGTDENTCLKTERHAVVVTGIGIEKLLGVSPIESGAGWAQAKETYALLIKWGVTDDTVAMCFDTTSTNSGRIKGAAVLLEKLLGKKLLHLACRHHVFELIVQKVFTELFGRSTGPEVQLFQQLKKNWQRLDKSKFSPIDDAQLLQPGLVELRMKCVIFCKEKLENSDLHCPRGDYKEFLELCLISMGESVSNSSSSYTFKVPGAMHNARWMAKTVYCLKTYLFRDQLELSTDVKENLKDICIFFCLVYVQCWFQAPSASDAAPNDLELCKTLSSYKTINVTIAEAAKAKLMQHLWYLSGEMVGLALFSSNISIEQKRQMLKAIKTVGDSWDSRSIKLTNVKEIEAKSLHEFVDSTTLGALKTLLGDDDVALLLKEDPQQWDKMALYTKMREKVVGLKVINDCAERAIALMSQFNNCLAKDEGRKRNILQVVEHNRKRVKSCSKDSLKHYDIVN